MAVTLAFSRVALKTFPGECRTPLPPRMEEMMADPGSVATGVLAATARAIRNDGVPNACSTSSWLTAASATTPTPIRYPFGAGLFLSIDRLALLRRLPLASRSAPGHRGRVAVQALMVCLNVLLLGWVGRVMSSSGSTPTIPHPAP